MRLFRVVASSVFVDSFFCRLPKVPLTHHPLYSIDVFILFFNSMPLHCFSITNQPALVTFNVIPFLFILNDVIPPDGVLLLTILSCIDISLSCKLMFQFVICISVVDSSSSSSSCPIFRPVDALAPK